MSLREKLLRVAPEAWENEFVRIRPMTTRDDLIGMTRVVVTHTLEAALLRRYDGILVLKNGRIAESGSFDELMEKKEYFYALFTVAQG